MRSRLPPSPHVWQRGARCCTGAEWWHVQPGSLARTHGAYAAPRTRVLSHGPTHVHARTRSEKTFSFTRPHGAWSVLEIPPNVIYSLEKKNRNPWRFLFKKWILSEKDYFFSSSKVKSPDSRRTLWRRYERPPPDRNEPQDLKKLVKSWTSRRQDSP